MDPSFIPSHKRPPDPTIPHEPNAKRRPYPPPVSSPSFKPSSPSDIVFRILCPSTKTGALIGKGGSVIRQLRELTGAKIYVDDSGGPNSDERLIVIVANSNTAFGAENQQGTTTSSNSNSTAADCDEGSSAQQALIRVFERIARLDEERVDDKHNDSNSGSNSNNGGGSEVKNLVACRLLAHGNQVGCVLGRGGKIVEKIRLESGAQVRVLPKDPLPACASPGDELIQVIWALI